MKKYILVSLGTAVAVVLALFVGLYAMLGFSLTNVGETVRLLATMRYIGSKYVEAVPDHVLVNGAIDGMMQSLGDKHSIYMEPTKFKAFQQQNEGTFGGVGVVMGFPEQGRCVVMSVLEGSPSEAAGVLAQDELLQVDGQPVKELQPEEIAQKVRGEEGTSVTLTIKRGEEEPFDLEITRAIIPLVTAKGTMVDNTNIGYIRIASFSENTGNEFKKELAALKEKQMQGLIIDLRANPGGLITSCLAIANEVVSAGEVVSLIDRDGHKEVYESKLTEPVVPLVILIDGNSASAAEILAGAVQDRQCGTLVGSKSFGKGSVQIVAPLFGGDGIKLTIAKYYTPSGRSIDGTGIEPDITVALPETATEDLQLQKALEILKEKMKP